LENSLKTQLDSVITKTEEATSKSDKKAMKDLDENFGKIKKQIQALLQAQENQQGSQ